VVGIPAVESNEGTMMNWVEIIKETEFADKAECLATVLAAAKIFTYTELQNAPRRLSRANSCGVDPYALVQVINLVFSTGIEETEE
jgi:hypothetical protein